MVMNTMGDQKVVNSASFDLIQNHIESLSSKMDRLINIQEKVLNRLDGMPQDVVGIEKDMAKLKVDKEEKRVPPRVLNQTQAMGGEMREMCQEMSSIMLVVNQRTEQQAQKLEGMEKLVLSMQQAISFIGETVKSSRVMKLMFKGPAARKASKLKDNKGKLAIKRQSSTDTITKKADELNDCKAKNGKEKPRLSVKDLKAQKKNKPPGTADTTSSKKQVLLPEEVEKLNKENAEKSGQQLTPGCLDLEAGVSPVDAQLGSSSCNLLDYLRKDSDGPVAGKDELPAEDNEERDGLKVNEREAAVKKETESKLDEEDVLKEKDEGQLEIPEVKEKEGTTAAGKDSLEVQAPEIPASQDAQKDPIPMSDDHKCDSPSPEAEQDQAAEASTSSKRHVTEEDIGVEDHKKIRVEEGEKEEEEQKIESEGFAVFRADGVEIQVELKQRVERERKEGNDTERKDAKRYFIDTTPPPLAPFNHRVVSAKPHQINNFYTINRQEILGGGRFGQVHKCIENSSGLTFAAKIIKARSQKEKDVVKNEIQVMNQLDHANLIQLYAAYESRNDIILVLEYVDGGELFDRIIDENYTLMELDTVMFIRQICEGLQHMHKMYILHLDLKPENILCVSRVTNQIKIIDFGLARMYKPREKLQVNFGTPEFLAPEVINFDFVSYNTDMWSLGVITYMLLSGLSPFLGDDDNETLNNILACQWNFDEEEFTDTSNEAKDFISKLLLINRSWRMGASVALRHPWLSDPVLHHCLHSKKTMCKSRRSSCVPPTDS